MPSLSEIKFGEVPFHDAIDALRGLVPMSGDEYYALSLAARRRAFSFAKATSAEVAEKIRKIAEQSFIDPVRSNFHERANAALEEFNLSLTPRQAETIFDTALNRARNDGIVEEAKRFESEYPFFGVRTSADSRVRANHYALDYQRAKVVFRQNDFLWTQMRPPFGYRCRCSLEMFRADDLQRFGLTVASGEEWYGRTVEVTLPGGETRAVQVLPDPGFGGGELTARMVDGGWLMEDGECGSCSSSSSPSSSKSSEGHFNVQISLGANSRPIVGADVLKPFETPYRPFETPSYGSLGSPLNNGSAELLSLAVLTMVLSQSTARRHS